MSRDFINDSSAAANRLAGDEVKNPVESEPGQASFFTSNCSCGSCELTRTLAADGWLVPTPNPNRYEVARGRTDDEVIAEMNRRRGCGTNNQPRSPLQPDETESRQKDLSQKPIPKPTNQPAHRTSEGEPNPDSESGD